MIIDAACSAHQHIFLHVAKYPPTEVVVVVGVDGRARLAHRGLGIGVPRLHSDRGGALPAAVGHGDVVPQVWVVVVMVVVGGDVVNLSWPWVRLSCQLWIQCLR